MNNNISSTPLVKNININIYDSSAWLEFRGSPKVKGVNTTTHFAKITDEVGKLHSCYVKLLNMNTPSLLGEAIGWLLANSNNVPCVQFACIVLVPITKLEKHITLPEWVKGYDTYPAWCTEIVNGKSLAQLHKWEYFLYKKKCIKSKDVSAMAAMDYWTDNKDRNSGNVIRTSSGKYIAIDHETLLHDLLWLPLGIKFEEKNLFNFARQELSTIELQQFHLDVAVAGNQHEAGYKSSSEAISEILFKIYGDQQNTKELNNKIQSFIEPRSKLGWLSNELGVIV